MISSRPILIFAATLALPLAALAADTVKKTDNQTVSGRVASTDADKVVVEKRAAKVDVPANQITAIIFDGEPAGLTKARESMAQGRYEDARKSLEGIDLAKVRRKPIQDEIDYLKILCAAQLALRGNGKVTDAGSQAVRFLTEHRDSRHWWGVNRLVGDLLVADRRYVPALDYYAKLSSAPWADYRLAADVGAGRARLAAGQLDQALAAFQKALDTPLTDDQRKDPAVVAQRQMAEIGKARCLSAQGQTDEALKMLAQVVDQADPANVELNAQAYNAQGAAFRAAGKPQDALLAYLHVDLLYFAVAEEHAEALANLTELWHETRRTDRAIQAEETLQQQYRNSRWATR